MNLKEIKELMELMRQMGVSELEVERSGVRVRIRSGRAAGEEPIVSVVHPLTERPSQESSATEPAAAPAEPERGVQDRR